MTMRKKNDTKANSGGYQTPSGGYPEPTGLMGAAAPLKQADS